MLKSIEVTRGICHYKKSVFFVMLKKMQENVKKNRDDVHETSPKIRSTELGGDTGEKRRNYVR